MIHRLLATDGEELRTAIAFAYGPDLQSDFRLRGAPMRGEVQVAILDGVSVSKARWEEGDLQVRGEVAAHLVILPRSGRAFTTHRGVETHLTHEQGVLLTPQGGSAISHGAGWEMMGLRFERPYLESQFQLLTGTSRGLSDIQSAVPLGGDGSLERLAGLLAEAAFTPDHFLGAPQVTSALGEALARALLLSQPAVASLMDSARACAPRHLRRAEEWMEAHGHQRVRMSEVARAAGVSVRSLERAFMAHRGCTPLAFLQELRLGRARRLLRGALPGKVTTIALECGFTTPGRFSAAYRARFGELPSETLHRGRRGPHEGVS